MAHTGRPPQRTCAGNERRISVARNAIFAFLCAACWLQQPAAQAADTRAEQARIPTVTRLVKTFTDVEITLAEKLRAGDVPAIEAMLTDDFEMRSSNRPGSPTPRADWIRESKARGEPPPRIEQMAVHDLGGGIAVVSYLQAREDAAKRNRVPDLLIVDVWKRAGAAWQLAIRYAGPSGSPELVIPGSAKEAPAPPKRY